MPKRPDLPERRVKLLVGIIQKNDGRQYIDITNENCVALHFAGIGSGTAKANYLSYLGINEIEKRVILSLIPNYAEKTVLRALNKKLRLYLTGSGIAFTVPLSGISNVVSNAVLSTPQRDEQIPVPQKNKKENSKMLELIIAVVNREVSDLAIDAARAAGATGATILHTHSVGNKQAEQLIGTTFSQETDTVTILTTHEFKHKIMTAIQECAGLKTKGGAILFSLPVDSLVGIGRFSDEE